MLPRTALAIGAFVVLAFAALVPKPTLAGSGVPASTTRAQTNPAANRSAPTTKRLTRGKYMVEVAGCVRCHSERDWNAPGAPPIKGKMGAGNYFVVGAGPIDQRKPPPQVYAPNITPDPETGVGRWSDEQLARSIRQSVDGEGRPFPPSFHTGSRNLSDDDVASVIAYLRTIPTVHKPAPPLPANSSPPAAAPTPVAPLSVPEPDFAVPLRRGEYLASVADCVSCHTAEMAGAPLRGQKFGGGKLMSDDPAHYVVSPNITMDPSGIGYYNQAMFVRVIRAGKVRARKLYPIMPWGYFRKMTDEDLEAIFAYLKNQPHIQHIVDNTEPPTMCRRCLHRHGAGDRN